MKPFSMTGFWWLPGKEDSRLNGVLKYSPQEGGTLELHGTFQKFKEAFNTVGMAGKSYAPDIILGVGHNGKKYTLLFNHQISMNSRLFNEELTITTYRIKYIIENQHFLRKNWLTFDEFSIRFNHLERWLGITGITRDWEDKEFWVNLKYKQPEIIKFNLNDQKIKIGNSINIKETHENNKNHFQLDEIVTIDMKSRRKIHLIDANFGILYMLQTFFSLGVGTSLQVNHLSAKRKENREKMQNGKYYNKSINIFFKISNFNNTDKVIHAHDMVFNYYDVHKNLDTFINNWVAKEKDLAPIYNLFFFNLQHINLYDSNIFLNAVQAIESYHRRINKKDMPLRVRIEILLKKY